MPRLSIVYIRAALIYLAVGFTLGAILLINKALALYTPTWRLLPIHFEVLLIGWFVLLAGGVAFWILPRLAAPAPRGNERLVWAAFWLINLGICLVIFEAIFSFPTFLLLGRLVEFAGVSAFVAGSWRRVKAFNG